MLIELVNKKAEHLTYGLYKQLLKINQDLSCNDLYDAIARNLGEGEL